MISPSALMRLRPVIVAPTRQISYEKLSNKKITRLESDIELGDCEFKGRLINRNPRNLEQLAFEQKPSGFWLDKSPESDWNRLVFEQHGRHLRAVLRHWSGKVLIETSTKEPKLSAYLKSTNTVQAATILGEVMSRRCLQSGYVCAGVDGTSEESVGVKTKAFFDSIVSSGFTLKESAAIEPRTVTDL